MAVKDPQATIGTMFSAAIARRIAGKPPASLREEEDEVDEKAEKAAPANKDSGAAPTNKAVSVTAKKAPAKKKGK